MKLRINSDYKNPEDNIVEVVERKGMGHPDTLADKLAEECSRYYSIYCLNKYGCVLHHNFDKLYIGAGLFRYEDNKIMKYHNIRVDLNGRVSNCMNGENIDVESILKPVIKQYLKSVMPRLNVDTDVDININCTNYSKRDYWYTPRNVEDIPDANTILANDTSLCVSHGGLTFCEKIALNVEQMFWNYNENLYPTPKYTDIGQDIKVMVSRMDKNVDVTLCVPVYRDKYETENEYKDIVKKYERLVSTEISNIDNPKNYKYSVGINRLPNEEYRNYSLVIGSCCECGEEGVVGRGNDSQGLISAFREHTMEAACGKNTRYHTGRVLSFMANNVTERIEMELATKSSLFCLTRNKYPLIEPFLFYMSIDTELNDDIKNKINNIVQEEFNDKFIDKIIKSKKVK